MRFDADSLFELLPSILRYRNNEENQVLKELLAVIGEQVSVLEENLDQLYDDQFIETCAEWLVPYIGDLIGAQRLESSKISGLSQRALIANAIAYRRRKGTVAVLEDLARDVTGWSSHAIEFFLLLATTQHLNHIRLNNTVTDLRDGTRLLMLNTPFDTLPHTVNVRRIDGQFCESSTGFYNLANLGIFLWRIRAFYLIGVSAKQLDTAELGYTFNSAGIEQPLFTPALTEQDISDLAKPDNVPLPLSRRRLIDDLRNARDQNDASLSRYYGHDKALHIVLDGKEVPLDKVYVGNIKVPLERQEKLQAKLQQGQVLIDPECGRLMLSEDDHVESVKVNYHYGFSTEMGGGTYAIDSIAQMMENVVNIPDNKPDLQSGLVDIQESEKSGIVEISVATRLEETLQALALEIAQQLIIRAGSGILAHIELQDEWGISGKHDSELVLEGLIISGGVLRVTKDAKLRRLRIRHCTLLSKGMLDNSSDEVFSLVVEAPNVEVLIEHCIVGGMRINENSHVRVFNSILDASGADELLYAGTGNNISGGPLQLESCTLIGQVHALRIDLANNCIFMASNTGSSPAFKVLQTQQGCIRFSYLPWDARQHAPRCYQCQPASVGDTSRVRPQFTSLRYGNPGYAQLSAQCLAEIWRGGEDGAEMGVFHDLSQAQLLDQLQTYLKEYLPFGLTAGAFFSS